MSRPGFSGFKSAMDESPIKGYVLKVMNVLTVLMALVALTAGGLGVYWGSYERPDTAYVLL